MQFKNFEIQASPHIMRATCTDEKCRMDLVQVDNGWFSIALYCPKCERVYVLKLVKVPVKKVSDEFIIECKKHIIEMKRKSDEARKRH